MRIILLVLSLTLTSLALAQSLQTGTKTTAEMWVAYTTQSSATATLKDDVSQALQTLWRACQQNAFHPLGLPILYLDLTSAETGMAQWEGWWPLVDQLDPARLPDTAQVKLKLVPPTRVAYAYHVGDPWGMAATFKTLTEWAGAHNVAVATRARAVVYLGPFREEPDSIVTECQLELKEQ